MRHAVVNKYNVVINVIKYKPDSNWHPPRDCYIVVSESADIGDWYDKESKKFFKTENVNGAK